MARIQNSSKSSKKKSFKDTKRKTNSANLFYILVACVAIIWMGFFNYIPSPVVTISSGDIRGFKVFQPNAAPWFVYAGIPFAKPPIGELRFKDPQTDGIQWEGVRETTWEGPICPQLFLRWNTTKLKERGLENISSLNGILRMLELIPVVVRRTYVSYTQNEDCLYLNVATPVKTLNATKVNELRPVLVWLHGGAFLVGDGGLDGLGPRHFMNEDIIVVSINYRLGALGFMNLQRFDAPGNSGAKDVVAALHWVQENIRQFGGDPNKVVVGGESAGAALAHYLTFSSMAKGLFHGIIAQSGSALHHWAFSSAEQARKRAHQLADAVIGNNVPRTDDEVVAILKNASASDITTAVEESVHSEEVDLAMDEFPFQLSPEVEVNGSQVFLPAPPLHLLRTSQFQDVPMILGVNSLEGVFWFISILIKRRQQEEELKRIADNIYSLMPEYIREHLSPDSSDMLIFEKQLRLLYFGGRSLHEVSIEEYLHLYGDLMFVFDTHRLTRELVAASKAPVYVYNFTAVGNLNLYSTLLLYDGRGGASHGDELGYMWDVSMIPTGEIYSGDYEDAVRKSMIALWANFIRTGNPTPKAGQSEQTPDIIWPAISNADMPVLRLDHPPSIQSGLRRKEMMFWDDIYRQVTSPAKHRQANGV